MAENSDRVVGTRSMIIMVHADLGHADIRSRLGRPQYSYYFAMRDFLPVIEQLGILVRLEDPRSEAGGVHAFCREIGEDCVFLSFSPPHLTEPGLDCPTIPVFPIEYYDLPSDRWNGEDRNDWRFVLGRLGRAITHSSHACDVVRTAMGSGFPVAAIPSPVWDRFAALRRDPDAKPGAGGFTLDVEGDVVDSRVHQPLPQAIPEAFSASTTVPFDLAAIVGSGGWRPQRQSLAVNISGVVYMTVFNSCDDRKNWQDILRAFCLALRDEADATLVLKIVHENDPDIRYLVIGELMRLAPLSCRVLLIDAFLDDECYAGLLQSSSYVVNASSGEGQCLPLMEAMSAGLPAIAPRHTAMADYVDASNALLVGSTLEPASWPHDPQFRLKTTRHRIDARSLHDAFRDSYDLAMRHPDRYRAMSWHATESLRRHCSRAVVGQKLAAFLADCLPSARGP